MRSYAMRGAVPVLLSAHLINITVTRQVSALNPALRMPRTLCVIFADTTSIGVKIWQERF